jgi:hypothetical protein
MKRPDMNKPLQLDPLAEKLLDRLAGRPECAEIVLGGYFALKHYLDYRTTHDVDAWWRTRPSRATERIIEEAMDAVAADEGLGFAKRVFGDTISFELLRDKKRVFSFQIALRSVELEPPIASPWPPILIETLADNIGAKMNALVDRGAPRDFSDIKRLADAGLVTVEKCWELWRAKNRQPDAQAAKDKVRLHLTALQARRPLETIVDAAERERAGGTRKWFDQEFLRP